MAIRCCVVASAESTISHTRERVARMAPREPGGNAMHSKLATEMNMHGQILNRCRAAAVGAMILWAALVGSAHAESVYQCRGADGAVAFQDRPCAGAQAESRVEILPAPPSSPSPDYGLSSRDDRGARTKGAASSRGNSKEHREVVSYECHAANGELFYRHGACPKQIAARDSTSASSSRGRSAKDKQSYAVSAQALSRSEVCRRIASGGARDGHERDDRVSTYDRNLGRDPCRYF
jgi:hypothetical protein